MTDMRFHRTAGAGRDPSFGDIAREEFWIVARSYFALVFGTVSAVRQLLRTVRRVDERALARGREKVTPPAE